MSKKHKHQRGPLTPRKSGAEPKAILVSYTNHDVEKGRLLPDQIVIAAATRILAGSATPLDYDSPIQGAEDECWSTVQTAVELLGGRMRLGWIVYKRLPATGRNRMAAYTACCHAVWEHDGRLVEAIPAYHGHRFVLDDTLPKFCQFGIDFLDCEADATRCVFAVTNLLKKTLPMRPK
jgi:hypothetical protein